MNAFDNRKAITGLTEPCSLIILERVFLDTLSISESSETVKDKGSIYCLFKIPPGCVGGRLRFLIPNPPNDDGFVKSGVPIATK